MPRLHSSGMALALWALPLHLQAATFVVTKTADTHDGRCDADCSLREAVSAANEAPGEDLIRLRHAWYGFTRAPDGDDDNSAGDLDLTDSAVIRGLPDKSSIDAQGLARVIQVIGPVRVALIDLVLKEGHAKGRGGCIYNEGVLTLRRTSVTRCGVFLDETGVLEGGGIFNLGELRLLLSKVYVNWAYEGTASGRGGGIFNAAGAVAYLYDSDIRNNTAGLDDAPGAGGGLFNLGAARVDRSFFFRNNAGDGDGAAMANRAGATLSVFNTTVSSNGHNGAAASVANGSRASLGAEAQGRLNLFNVTIADNNGGGLYNNGKLSMRNTLVAGNFARDDAGRRYDAGINCINDGPGTITQTRTLMGADGNCPGDIVVDNGRVFRDVLFHLAYIGGPTPAHPQRPGPYTIDQGHPTECPGEDQRNYPRPVDGDGDGIVVCDIGAVEHVAGG